MIVELDPDSVNYVVKKSLMDLYYNIHKPIYETPDFGEVYQAVNVILYYYMTPEEYEDWCIMYPKNLVALNKKGE